MARALSTSVVASLNIKCNMFTPTCTPLHAAPQPSLEWTPSSSKRHWKLLSQPDWCVLERSNGAWVIFLVACAFVTSLRSPATPTAALYCSVLSTPATVSTNGVLLSRSDSDVVVSPAVLLSNDVTWAKSPQGVSRTATSTNMERITEHAAASTTHTRPRVETTRWRAMPVAVTQGEVSAPPFHTAMHAPARRRPLPSTGNSPACASLR